MTMSEFGQCSDCGVDLVAFVATPDGKRVCLRCSVPVLLEHVEMPDEEKQALKAVGDALDRQN